MKKLFLSLALSLGMVFAVPAASTFAATPSTTDVTGTVTAGGKGVNGATVEAVCAGPTGDVNGSDTTDNEGGYLIHLNPSTCPAGSTINVTAHSGSNAGSNSGKAKRNTSKMNIALVDVNIALPEMGTIVGGLTAIGAGAAFLVVRRKQQAN